MKYLITFLTIPVIAGLMGLSYAAYSPQEDDRFWNCHITGDHLCGQAAPWHGFPNLTSSQAALSSWTGGEITPNLDDDWEITMTP